MVPVRVARRLDAHLGGETGGATREEKSRGKLHLGVVKKMVLISQGPPKGGWRSQGSWIFWISGSQPWGHTVASLIAPPGSLLG